jgi:hypothetical protein
MNNTLTPKEKALEIANAMYEGDVFTKTKQQHLEELENAKRRALVIIKHIINSAQDIPITYATSFNDYWYKVQIEADKLLTDV